MSMAVFFTVFLHFSRTNGKINSGTQRYFRKFAVEKHGIEYTMVDLTDLDEFKAALRPNTKAIYADP